ncbi:hypothetical protein B0T17DRAFT_518629 [Bombardia bombarda]|uniref:Spo12-like protein n=1 Tax=Bombardia bombarda TaxID=252184 RepID=A0AA39XMA9_9PEZI|nr:hypothetical protein B0T17DRAFT_518629 [Bombardia bombarda]
MSSNVLAAKDINASFGATTDNNTTANATEKDVKSMEYHRQVLQSKMEEDEGKQYVSPSDTIMSPCTAKLSAFRNKQVGKVKPKSLFAQASTKKLEGDNLFGSTKSANSTDSN